MLKATAMDPQEESREHILGYPAKDHSCWVRHLGYAGADGFGSGFTMCICSRRRWDKIGFCWRIRAQGR